MITVAAINLAVAALNAAGAILLISRLRCVAKLHLALSHLALSSIALRHSWRAQIIALMAIIDRETMEREINQD